MTGRARRRLGRWWWILPALGAGTAFAAGLSVTGQAVGAGKAAAAACDGDGVTVAPLVESGTNITKVNVGGISGDCSGGTVKVTVHNRSDPAREGMATIPQGTAPFQVTVTLAAAVPLKDVGFVAVALAAP